MTKDEYEDFVLRYKGCGACFPMYHTLSRFEKMWFSAIQKDVAELEKENAQWKQRNETLKDALEHARKLYGDELEKAYKENAELKGIKDVATLIRANNDTVITLMQLNNMLVSKSQQLTNAKELLKEFVHHYKAKTIYIENMKDLLEQAEQFLKE